MVAISGFSVVLAQGRGLGETGGFGKGIWAPQATKSRLGRKTGAQDPGLGETARRAAPLPARTPAAEGAQTGGFLPRRDVVSKCGQFAALKARSLPSQDDVQCALHNVTAREKLARENDPNGPNQAAPRFSNGRQNDVTNLDPTAPNAGRTRICTRLANRLRPGTQDPISKSGLNPIDNPVVDRSLCW